MKNYKTYIIMMTVNTNWAMPVRTQNQNDSPFIFATHTISMVYNVSMAWYYNYLLKKAYTMESEYTYEQIQTIKQERLKHTVSGVLMAGVLIACAISSMRNNEMEERKIGGSGY